MYVSVCQCIMHHASYHRAQTLFLPSSKLRNCPKSLIYIFVKTKGCRLPLCEQLCKDGKNKHCVLSNAPLADRRRRPLTALWGSWLCQQSLLIDLLIYSLVTRDFWCDSMSHTPWNFKVIFGNGKKGYCKDFSSKLRNKQFYYSWTDGRGDIKYFTG